MKGCFFGGVKSADSHKYLHTGYGIGFNSRLEFSLPDGSVGKSIHKNNKKIYFNSW